MSVREKLENKQFNDIIVTEYLGQKKYNTKCTKCGENKIMWATNIKRNVGTRCDKENIVIDLTGQTFGDWTVLEYVGNKKYLCECSCENHTRKIVRKANLINGSSTSCGHSRNSYGDLTGQTFGDWKVLRKKGYQWECVCSCDDTKIHLLYAADLVNGKTKSCGHDYNTFEDISGNTYGLWKVLEYIGNGTWKCECQCENKTIQFKKKATLINGKSTSCGCNKIEKIKQTLLKKYGETAPNKVSAPRTEEQIQAISSKEELINFIDNTFNKINVEYKPKPLELSNLLGIGLSRTLSLIHKYELEDKVNIRAFESVEEKEVLNYIQSIYNKEIIVQDRSILKGKELDIYIPEKKIAIEFNGYYWHSDLYKDKRYHQEKTIECAKKGIRLIHIFEYEWLDVEKQLKIKNLLKSILGANEVERLYARKLKVVEIDNSEAYKFEDKYHLQGKSNSSINIALKSENEIIGIMTFNKPRFNREYEYELIRLCWKQNIIVIGGAERMFKYFIKNYNAKSIVTYTDISKFTGNVYIRLGFKPIQPKPITEPNYVWVSMSGDCILNRYQTQKKKLIERGLGEPNQTEDEIMRSKDFLKVYDSGNIKLEYRKETSNGNK